MFGTRVCINPTIKANLVNNPYINIRTAVFLSQYGFVLVGSIIAIAVAGLWPFFNIYPFLGVMLGFIFRTLFVQTRYVAGFEIKEDVLQVKYITAFFAERIYLKTLHEITNINLEKAHELNILTTGKCETFDLTTKKIKSDIESKLASANISFLGAALKNQLSTNRL